MSNPYYPNWLNDFNPVIPTAFDNALSYHEEMKKLYIRVGEAIQYVMENEARIRSMVEELVELMVTQRDEKLKERLRREWKLDDSKIYGRLDAKILSLKRSIETEIDILKRNICAKFQEVNMDFTRLRGEFNQLTKEVQNFYNNTNQQFVIVKDMFSQVNETLTMHTGKLAEIMNQVSQLYISFDDFKLHVTGIIEERFAALSDIIEEQVAKMNGDILIVTNPVTGKRDTLKKVLDDIYGYRTPFPITAKQLDDCHITATELDALHVTAKEFDDKAYLILLPWINGDKSPGYLTGIQELKDRVTVLEEKVSEKWISGFTQKYETPYQCYVEIINFLQAHLARPISAKELDELNLTALELDEKHITAYDLTWNAGSILKR